MNDKIIKCDIMYKVNFFSFVYTFGFKSLTTGNPNTLSAIKINVPLFTCVLVSFLSRLEGI